MDIDNSDAESVNTPANNSKSTLSTSVNSKLNDNDNKPSLITSGNQPFGISQLGGTNNVSSSSDLIKSDSDRTQTSITNTTTSSNTNLPVSHQQSSDLMCNVNKSVSNLGIMSSNLNMVKNNNNSMVGTEKSRLDVDIKEEKYDGELITSGVTGSPLPMYAISKFSVSLFFSLLYWC